MGGTFRAITRRRLTGGLALLALPGAACAGPAGPAERSPIEGVQPAGRITWMVPTPGAVQMDNMLNGMKRYEAGNPGVQVETLYPEFGPGGATYREKAVSMISAGSPPELLFVDAYWAAGWVAQKMLQPLTGYIKGDKTFRLDAYLDGTHLEDHHIFKGVYYGLTHNPESPRVLYYNRTKWLENGLPLPNALDQQGRWTWDAMLEHLTRISKGAPPARSYGILAQLGVVPEPHTWIFSNGGKTLADDKLSFVGDMKETVEALQFQADLIHKHQVAPKPTDDLGPGATLGAFLNGRLAMWQTGVWAAPGIMAVPEFDYGIVSVPKGPKGLRRTVVKPNSESIPVGVSGPRAAAAWELAKYIAGPEWQKGLIDAGQSLTHLKSQVDYFLKHCPIKDSKTFVEPYERKEVTHIPLIPRWVEYTAVVDEEFNKVRSGEAGVPAAVGAIKARVNEVLKS
jgi:multiple sugar transport system substrate-binding protein